MGSVPKWYRQPIYGWSLTRFGAAVVLFIILYKVVLTFESVDEILKCGHSNESYLTVTLSCGVLKIWGFLLVSKMSKFRKPLVGLFNKMKKILSTWDTPSFVRLSQNSGGTIPGCFGFKKCTTHSFNIMAINYQRVPPRIRNSITQGMLDMRGNN